MDKIHEEKFRSRWLSIPIIATITRFLCRELTFQVNYLRAENKILKSKIKKRIILTSEERGTFVGSCGELKNIICKEFLGGPLKSYQKAA